MDRGEFLDLAMKESDAYRERTNCGAPLDARGALRLLQVNLDADISNPTEYLSKLWNREWVARVLGVIIYNYQVMDAQDCIPLKSRTDIQDDKDGDDNDEDERIGVTTRDKKVRARLPKCVRQGKVTPKAKHGNRELVAARVEVGLVAQARKRGNISQTVEAALKLYFAE